MTRDIIRPMWNVPVVVKFDRGPEAGVEKYSPVKKITEYQYFVNDDEGMIYLPRQTRDALLKANAQAGDSVRLIKQKRDGEEVYDVSVVPDSHEPAPAQSNGFSDAKLKLLAPVPVAAPALNRPGAAIMGAAMFAAVDVLVAMRAYAAEKGLEIDGVSIEDVRAIAIAMYIHAGKAGRS